MRGVGQVLVSDRNSGQNGELAPASAPTSMFSENSAACCRLPVAFVDGSTVLTFQFPQIPEPPASRSSSLAAAP